MTRPFLLWFLPALTLMVSGCTQFPELEQTQTAELEAAEYPALIPIEPLLAQAAAPAPDPVQLEASLNARLSNLRNRADAMRGSVLTGAERQRLEQGLR